jgi:hypothetical protein
MGDVNEVKKSKRKTPAAQMQREVCLLRKDLAKGLSEAEIRQKRKWTAWQHRKRMEKAREMSEREYNPERFYEIFLRYEASYRALQKDGRVIAGMLLRCIRKRKRKVKGAESGERAEEAKGKNEERPGVGRMCRLAHAWVAVTREVGEWEEKIVRMARGLGIIPTPAREAGVTVEQMLEDSLDENGNEYGAIGEVNSLPAVAGQLALNGAQGGGAKEAVERAGGDNRQRVGKQADGGAGGARGG